MSLRAITDRSHHGDDLLDGRRVRGILLALVAGRTPAVISGHRDRRAAVTGGVQQHGFHKSSL
jgi:hypothetical protein